MLDVPYFVAFDVLERRHTSMTLLAPLPSLILSFLISARAHGQGIRVGLAGMAELSDLMLYSTCLRVFVTHQIIRVRTLL